MTEIHAFDPDGTPSPGAEAGVSAIMATTLDPQVASYVTGDATETSTALASTLVARGTILHDVRDYGATGDGTTDDSAAFQAAINAAKATQGRAYAWGTFRLDQPITVDANADFANAIVNYYGTGIAFTVTGFRLSVTTPKELWNRGKTYGGGWDVVAGSIGVRLLNTNGCEIHVPFVANFEQGLSCYGQNGGCAYNTVYIGWLFNNKLNQVIDTDSSISVGYSNQNTYIGGRMSHSSLEGDNVAGTASIYTTGAGDGGPNNNVWLNTCIEGATAEYAFNLDRARNNKLINVRVEYGNTGRFGPGARSNEVVVGYSNPEFVIVHEEGGNTNDVLHPSTQVLQNKNIEHRVPGDPFPWMRTMWGSRSLELGHGKTAPTQLKGGNGYLSVDGGFRPASDGVRDLGNESFQWRSVLAGRGMFSAGVDIISGGSTQAPATAGRARMYVITNASGKLEMRVRWPGGAFTTLAAEP